MAEKTRRSRMGDRIERRAPEGGRKVTQTQKRQGTVKTVSGKKGKKKKKGMPVALKIALGLCCMLLFVILAAIGVIASKIGKLNYQELDPDKLSISDEVQIDETGTLTVALFGLDTRANNDEMGTRSDTIMVACLDRATKKITLSSVYRDTLLKQEDGSFNKANAAYSFGGMEKGAEKAVAMLNRNLGLNIERYVTVDFAAMVDVIDALGGIEIDVTEEEIPYINGYAVEIIENTGVDTWAVENPGYQNLTGVQATAYARIRYTAGDDFKRAERQRLVLSKIAEKAQQADLATLNKIVDRVFPKVWTNFTLPEILAYAKDVKLYQLGETVGFPFDKDTMEYMDVGDCVIPLNLIDNVEKLHEYLYGTTSGLPWSDIQEISDELVFQTGMGSSSGGDSEYDPYGNGSSYSGTDGTGTYSGDGTGNTWDGSGTGSGNTWDGGTGSGNTWDGSGTDSGNTWDGTGSDSSTGTGSTDGGYGNTGGYTSEGDQYWDGSGGDTYSY